MNDEVVCKKHGHVCRWRHQDVEEGEEADADAAAENDELVVDAQKHQQSEGLPIFWTISVTL